jgi:hypothetical protein
VLDRLQRLESQNQALTRAQNTNQSSNIGTGQQTAHLVLTPEDRENILSNHEQKPPSGIRVSPARDGSPASGMIPRMQPSNAQQLPSSKSSRTAPDEATDPPWKSDEFDASHDSGQIASNEADAMGAASVCDENSPQESTQYYGGSSGIAFMRTIRHVLGDTGREEDGVESTPSTTDGTNLVGVKQSMRSELSKLLPTFDGPRFRPDFFALPSRTLADTLLENFWTRVYPLCPFIHRPTFEAAYATLWNPAGGEAHLAQESDAGLGNIIDAGPSNQSFYCALNMMLALGTQFLDISVSQRKNITSMFEQRSKNLLAVDMMDRGSIAVVQTLLLNGQYLQSTFCPQRCWNCIGVACRIAQGLGLHVDPAPMQKSSLGQEMRRRVWYACMMLDM